MPDIDKKPIVKRLNAWITIIRRENVRKNNNKKPFPRISFVFFKLPKNCDIF